MPSGIVVSGGSKSFHTFLAEVLADCGIEPRLAPETEMSDEIRLRPSSRIGFDMFCLLVSQEDEQQARKVIQHTILNCKICLRCVESYVKPGERSCPQCGELVDLRHPDEIRKQYVADCIEATRQNL